MFLDILRFELGYHRRQNLVWILCGVFFLLTFAVVTTPNVQMVGGIDNLNINAPYVIVATMGACLLFTMFGSVAFSANAVVRDFELGTVEMFFSRPVAKFDYVYGRFFGALFYAYCLFFAAMAGLIVGEFMPWLDQERVGQFSAEAYLFSFFVIGVPGLFIVSSIFFCIAAATRSMMWTYVGVVVLLMLSFVLDTFNERDTIQLVSILDPFGTTSIEEVTRYWTAFERNTQVPGIDGAFLANRMLWMGIGVAALVAAYPLFPFTLDRARNKAKADDESEATSVVQHAVSVANQHFSGATYFRQFLSQTRLEVKNVVQSVPFIIVLLLGILMVTGNAAGGLESAFGTAVLPTTYGMVRLINGAFTLALLIVLIYYAGELMVREKSVGLNEILDAMPFPNWIMIGAKLTGMVVVIVSMLMAAMVAGIGVQLFNGFYEIDVGLYLTGLLFFFQIPIYLMIVLAMFFYVVTRSKYVTMFMMVMYFVTNIALPAMGFEHFLYRARQLQPLYSDFTGYSQNIVPYLWQTLYWGLFGLLMLIVVHLLWPRGTEDSWSNRLKTARGRLSFPVVVGGWVTASLFMLVGSVIYYNTVVLNPYVTQDDQEAAAASYEKQYKKYQYLSMPVITKVYAEVALFPDDRDILLEGRYTLVNQSPLPQHEIHFSVPPQVTADNIQVPNSQVTLSDQTLGYRIYQLDNPLAVGESIEVAFEMDWRSPGFANQGHSPKVTRNGTFVNNADFFPMPGYQDSVELIDNNRRRKLGLPPVERFAPIDDEEGLLRAGFQGGRVEFETVFSTSPDQIGIAPGYLQKEWIEDGRRYFHYKMDAPIWNFFSYMSADYEVKRDRWEDVAIEVYFKHDYNVDTMIRSSQNSLEYFSRNFSPYQYRQYRILEFPGFQGRFAQSFPNTIPFSEDIGFKADIRDNTEIDYVYYVTAHELAHQWWAHQVLGADVQGQTMIVETLAQYSALMVMEKEYGKETMQRFLRYEMDRYLAGRGSELLEEMPLFLVENQPYIHYRKGSVVLYALRDYLGEELVNSALSDFLDRYAFKAAPYPTTRELIGLIAERAGPEYQGMIGDLLEKIVIYDLKVVQSDVVERDDGQFEVTVEVAARKFEADGEGRETDVPLSLLVDIGVLGGKQGDLDMPEVLHLEKYRMDQPTGRFTIVVDKKPVSVGIDPMNKLIDRNPEDNVTEV